MLHAEQFAKDHHGKVMDLTSGLRRAKDGSHDFYKSLGYKNHGYFEKLYLRKEL
jgi:histone acetyltransferase (RNA polymerase elongator complex component)